MSYSIDNIIPVNFFLKSAGLSYADFSSAMLFVNFENIIDEDLATMLSESGTVTDLEDEKAIRHFFSSSGEAAAIIGQYFSSIPKPPSISFFVKRKDETLLSAIQRAEEKAWRYHYFFMTRDYDVYKFNAGEWEPDLEAPIFKAAAYADRTGHPMWLTYSKRTKKPYEQYSNTFLDAAFEIFHGLGHRYTFVGCADKSAPLGFPKISHNMVQLAAKFHKFRPFGKNTAITGEYQIVTGYYSDEEVLNTQDYSKLKFYNSTFFTNIELAGQRDSLRAINTKSTSAYGEYIDDVINLDVLKNHIQVDGYNYLANVGTKRALIPRDYGGLLSVISSTCKRFYDNGVLGAGSYVDPHDGQTKITDFGYVIWSKPEDVLEMTTEQRKRRAYPPVQMIVLLARAGHMAEINITVE